MIRGTSGYDCAMSELSARTDVAEPRAAFEAELRRLRNDVRNVALPGLLATYAGVVVLMLAPWWSGWAWAPLLTFVPMGLLQYRIVISGHEAVHRTLCRPAWLNEALGVVGQALVGVNFASYRVQHLEHHRSADVADDPDGHIYGPIVAARPGWPRLFVWTFGTFAEIAVKILQKGAGSVGTPARPSPESLAASRRHTLYVVLAQLALALAAFAITGRVTGYVELWLLPLLLVTVFINRTRILVEHGYALLTDDGRTPGRLPTIDMVVPAWERWLFAPFRFDCHGSHHLHLTVPHHHLPRLRELLREQGAVGFREVRGSYLRAIYDILRMPTPR